MALSHDHSRRSASSNTLLVMKVWLSNTVLFLWCHMVHVRATHQHFHLAALVPPAFPMVCCRKCSFGFYGKATFVFTKDNDSHQRGIVLLQLKKRCAAFSSILLHSGHLESVNSTCLLLRLAFVGNLSLMSLHANVAALGGILSFHSSTKGPSSVSPLFASSSMSYADFVE